MMKSDDESELARAADEHENLPAGAPCMQRGLRACRAAVPSGCLQAPGGRELTLYGWIVRVCADGIQELRRTRSSPLPSGDRGAPSAEAAAALLRWNSAEWAQIVPPEVMKVPAIVPKPEPPKKIFAPVAMTGGNAPARLRYVGDVSDDEETDSAEDNRENEESQSFLYDLMDAVQAAESSGASGAEDTPRKKRRTIKKRQNFEQKRFNPAAVSALEKFFTENAYPSLDDASEFIKWNRGVMNGEDAHRCLVWFTNRRTKYKKVHGELPPKPPEAVAATAAKRQQARASANATAKGKTKKDDSQDKDPKQSKQQSKKEEDPKRSRRQQAKFDKDVAEEAKSRTDAAPKAAGAVSR